MRQRLLNHGSFLVILSVVLTFLAASVVMYDKFSVSMKQGVRDEVEYIRAGIDAAGIDYLQENVKEINVTRITVTDSDGNVIYESNAEADEMENHGKRPEMIKAKETGYGEVIRFSETLSKQTFYCAMRLENGNILRVARTTDSVFMTLFSSFTLLGLITLGILILEVILVQKQTKDLIKPINELDLENPLKNVKYEELRPLLGRVDQQNRQIVHQMEELKEAEAMRREFSANVSHELKTPLMSISGYAELMMNGMVDQDKVPEFSGRIYHEASRLSSLVSDIIQLSRLDEKNSDMPFEAVDIYELAEDIIMHLKPAAEKKKIQLSLEGERVVVRGVRQVLYEMFYNIADNAIRYTDAGGKISIFAGQKEMHPCYSVEDNGIGIPKNEQKRIFERFYRVDKSHSRQTGGTGLGLSIVKHGAVLHKAKINLESELGKGTKMELVF
ncbi:sensor histidine kinase [Blautia sp.]|jgi:two-component system phosphate regulon sensor histidine kinase PhoR|uniref:sensor histidine kinase n=1 Tax=Blautia sp. TaxID=1955243 RepID=UPI00280C0898|nr:ATP-binding protein [Blautia sp.]MDY3015985.1 ATP-binding protein [Blautia sp.]MED9882171.1 ATP-binding protein [Blautia sp.]